jgi:hypothetical protein
MSIQKLIDQTFSYSVEAKGTDLEQLYLDDLNAFEAVQWLINADEMDAAIAKIDNMDTEPREQIVLAIADEYGSGYVETVIGYEVA